ncbi:hypothetical protein UlMin_016616 [Ulmus minor]
MVHRRSSSSYVETKVKRNGFRKFGKLFRKKKEKYCGNKSVGGFDEKSEMWVVDHIGVSKSISLCSFRNGGWFGSEDRCSILGARSSSVTACMVLDSGRRSGFGFLESMKSGEKKDEGLVSEFSFDYRGVTKIDLVKVNNNNVNGGTRRVFSLREIDGMDEYGFIDLKLDYSAEFIPKLSSESAFGSMRGSSEYSRAKECGASFLFCLQKNKNQ